MKQDSFTKELESLINRYSLENGSDTPDFILASYLLKSLLALNIAIGEREKWYGRGKIPMSVQTPAPSEE